MYPHYNIHPLFDTLPAARQKTYLKVAQSDHSLAQDLYLWNLETTSAVFQTISFVEVTMRNIANMNIGPKYYVLPITTLMVKTVLTHQLDKHICGFPNYDTHVIGRRIWNPCSTATI